MPCVGQGAKGTSANTNQRHEKPWGIWAFPALAIFGKYPSYKENQAGQLVVADTGLSQSGPPRLSYMSPLDTVRGNQWPF